MVQAPWPLSNNEQQQAMLQEEKNQTVVEEDTKTPFRGCLKSFSSRCVWCRGYLQGKTQQGSWRFPGCDGTFGARCGLAGRLLLMCPACAGARSATQPMEGQGNPVWKEVRKDSLQYPFALSSDFASSFPQTVPFILALKKKSSRLKVSFIIFLRFKKFKP